jgi:hypothetical protein
MKDTTEIRPGEELNVENLAEYLRSDIHSAEFCIFLLPSKIPNSTEQLFCSTHRLSAV